ncbi:MmcQ/YjbR family DNA-binding protein [Actinomadura barringtoniae]|uniref:MmcQ/YjbR family DNA-binding protein n=1 Tax=Actinomadura barringtoniae TaxID=1427535 RepID=A0A939T1J0_9ACTN|nr:DUF1801 domain-containing protein [Actinomadura barringtoniae]MBO2447711.1 MmcQ/YjbR family DNA-binding protein [Actinomadura barringtoniae]
MTTLAQLRKTAFRLPEVEEGTHFGMVAFSVRGKGFASISKDGQVQVQLPVDEMKAALAAHPSGEELARNGKPIGFRVPLDDIDGKDLNALVRASWLHRAPRQLAETLVSAEAGDDSDGSDGSDGDLPDSP